MFYTQVEKSRGVRKQEWRLWLKNIKKSSTTYNILASCGITLLMPFSNSTTSILLLHTLVSTVDLLNFCWPHCRHFCQCWMASCATLMNELDDVIQHLACMFRDMPMDYYTGFQVHHDPHTHTIFINQAHYVSDIIKQFQLDTANFVSTPADTHLPLQATQGPDDLALPPSVLYCKAVGCLTYAMVLTRPNVAFDIS